MRAMLVLFGLFCIVALGCATTTEEKTLTSGPPADVAGTWTGYAGTGTSTAAVTLMLDQKGTDRRATSPSADLGKCLALSREPLRAQA